MALIKVDGKEVQVLNGEATTEEPQLQMFLDSIQSEVRPFSQHPDYDRTYAQNIVDWISRTGFKAEVIDLGVEPGPSEEKLGPGDRL